MRKDTPTGNTDTRPVVDTPSDEFSSQMAPCGSEIGDRARKEMDRPAFRFVHNNSEMTVKPRIVGFPRWQ